MWQCVGLHLMGQSECHRNGMECQGYEMEPLWYGVGCEQVHALLCMCGMECVHAKTVL